MFLFFVSDKKFLILSFQLQSRQKKKVKFDLGRTESGEATPAFRHQLSQTQKTKHIPTWKKQNCYRTTAHATLMQNEANSSPIYFNDCDRF